MLLLSFPARMEQVQHQHGLGDVSYFESHIPTLAHRGNVTPRQDDEDGKRRKSYNGNRY